MYSCADIAPSDMPGLLDELHQAGLNAPPLLKFADRLECCVPGTFSRRFMG